MKKLLKSENKIQDISFKIKSVDNVNNTVEGIFSTQAEDRHGEIVVQSGWILDNYMKNPIVLWAHQSDQPPIAKMLNIGVNAGTNQLEGKMQFAVKEYPFAQTIFDLIVGGYQKAFSAGFINNKYEINQETEQVLLLENELLEVSAVPVPANQLALAKAKGIDVSLYEKEIKTKDVDDEDEPDTEDLENIEKDEDDEMNEEKALEHISKSNLETITRAIKTLSGVLKERSTDKAKAEDGARVEHPVKTGGRKIPIPVLNQAIRELMAVKYKL